MSYSIIKIYILVSNIIMLFLFKLDFWEGVKKMELFRVIISLCFLVINYS